MRYLAVATDYDGTLAKDGVAGEGALAALERLRQSGRKAILVTGRELQDLENTFPRLDLFDRVVVENGAMLYHPASREKRVLAPPPSAAFVNELKKRGVAGLSVGDVIVATWRPHETAVLETIRDLGLELHIVFNKDAVMVLPAGINKMTGLNAALADLKLSRHNVVGIGDAENDHSFLSCCECSAAVANAIPALKEKVDLVTRGERGAGVEELIDCILKDDLRSVTLRPDKHGVPFGREGDRDLHLDAGGQMILLCGQSGGGKSTFVAGLIERLAAREYQVCVIDPEGDYENFTGFFTVGDEHNPPGVDQIFQLLEDPSAQLIVNLMAIQMKDRPGFFTSLLGRCQEYRLKQGRPHWLVIDEAHHLLPKDSAPAPELAGGAGSVAASMLLVTVHPGHVSPAALRDVNVLAVIGKEPRKMAEEFAKAAGVKTPAIAQADLESGEASVWFREGNRVIERMKTIPGKAERKRHRRKYAEGELEEDLQFRFRGPQGKLNLRAQNLTIFLQLAEGVDDETWTYHLHCGDYSKWLSRAIKDSELVEEVAAVERSRNFSPANSRQEIRKAIEARYTASE